MQEMLQWFHVSVLAVLVGMGITPIV